MCFKTTCNFLVEFQQLLFCSQHQVSVWIQSKPDDLSVLIQINVVWDSSGTKSNPIFMFFFPDNFRWNKPCHSNWKGKSM